MAAPAMKTLRISLVDLSIIPAGPGGTAAGDVWARLSKQVRTVDGQVVVLAAARKTLNGTGIVDFAVPANNDTGIHADDRGFGIVVGWDLTARGPTGTTTRISNAGTTVLVTSASPAVVTYSSLAPAVPTDALSSYPTEATVDAKIAAERTTERALQNSTFTRISRGAINVKDFGAMGDNLTSDTAAIQAAINATPHATIVDSYSAIYLPNGIYLASELDTTGKKILFKGDDQGQSRLRYNGSGGLGTRLVKCGTMSAGAQPWGGFSHISLDGFVNPANRCENLYKMTGTAGHDWGFKLEDFSVGGCMGDAIDFGSAVIINLHIDRFRADDLGGYAFRLRGTTAGESRPITLSRGTIDSGTIGVVKGLMRVDNGQGYYIHVRDVRLEGNTAPTAELINGVTKSAWFANYNTLASFGAYYWFENVMGFGAAATTLLRDASPASNAIRARFDVVNMWPVTLFDSAAYPASNVAAVTPQDLQTRFASAG